MNWHTSIDKNRIDGWMRSKWFSGVVIGVLGTLTLVITFELGMAAGFHRAEFSYHLDQNYGRTFGRTDARMTLPGTGAPNPHGAFGKVVSVSLPTVTIATDGRPEQEVLISADTQVRDQDATVAASTLKEGDYIIVLGAPNESGQVAAKLVRIVPAPTTAQTVPTARKTTTPSETFPPSTTNPITTQTTR